MLSLQSPQRPDPGKREPEDGISLLPRPGELTPSKAGLTRPTYPPDSDSLPPTTPSLGPGFALRPLPCSVPGVSEGPLPLPPWARRSPGSPWTVVQSSLLPSLPLRPVSAVAPASMLLTCGSLVSGHPPPKRPPPKGRGVCQFTARSPGPGWPQQGLQHLVRQGGGGGKGEGGQAAPHLTGHPSPHAGCLLTARTPAATAPSDFSVGRGVACAGPDKCPPRAGDRAVPRTSASRRLGRAGGRHPPGAEDNFIKLDLIKEQTAFKTNLKSMDVHTHPPRILMAATLYLPNPFYPGSSRPCHGNGLIGFLRPSQAGSRLGELRLFSRPAGRCRTGGSACADVASAPRARLELL